ncbi:DUF2231 domain-containing protein [Sinorhizobium meliloti]|uniref:DUF2231 domain-containing protein n=1 Tax=Rhizobium meliloti TaxID=382 RepID=UPI00299CE1A9
MHLSRNDPHIERQPSLETIDAAPSSTLGAALDSDCDNAARQHVHEGGVPWCRHPHRSAGARKSAQHGERWGHPIHSVLVPFPLACLVGVFATDILFQVNGQAGWQWPRTGCSRSSSDLRRLQQLRAFINFFHTFPGLSWVRLYYGGWKGGELLFRHGVGVPDKHAR